MSPVGEITAMMPGRILSILVKEGQRISAGETLCILEAMKMHNEVRAPRDGIVADLRVAEGAIVNGGDLLMNVKY